MKITFIYPAVGKRKKNRYIRTWQMEPLSIAVLSGLTPKYIERNFFDDRLEEIDYNVQTNLVAMSVETYTAKRAYEIAAVFRARGKKIIMGGFHATLCPEEVQNYADAIVVGEVENLWTKILHDAKNNNLHKVYQSAQRPSLDNICPDRSIYKNKKYLKLGLIETGRGCRFNCDFCSVTNFFNHHHRQRPIDDIIKEIKSLHYKYYFFVDDNVCMDFEQAKKLFNELKQLKIKWISQANINIANDQNLLKLMKESGCIGILIGFESLDKDTLTAMNKPINIQTKGYDEAVEKIHKYGLRIYGTFVFGYGQINENIFREAFNFSMKHKFFLAAFNHLVPFPGTPLYKKLQSDNRLLYNQWWLEHSYSFGEVSFKPINSDAKTLSNLCFEYRKKFYSFASIIKRFFNFWTNFNSLNSPFIFLFVNILSKIDVKKRQGLPMGKQEN